MLTYAGERVWGLKQVSGAELGKIILSKDMLADHSISSYIDAVQNAVLRYLPECQGANARAASEEL